MLRSSRTSGWTKMWSLRSFAAGRARTPRRAAAYRKRDVREIAARDPRKEPPRIHEGHAIRGHGQRMTPRSHCCDQRYHKRGREQRETYRAELGKRLDVEAVSIALLWR